MKGVLASLGRLLTWYLLLSAYLMLLTIACTTQPTSTPVPPTATAAPAAAQPAEPPTSTPAAAAPIATLTPTPAQSAPTARPEPTQASSPAPTDAPSAPLDLAADIVDFTLPQLTVQPGTTVTWTNRDGATHTATSGVPGSLDGVWDSSALSSGDSFSFTFEQPGEFSYFCRIHPFMTGTVTVE